MLIGNVIPLVYSIVLEATSRTHVTYAVALQSVLMVR